MRREEGGQAIVLFAVSLPLFLALMLLVIDGGRALVEHERLRNAAQFAAEAVASLAGDPSGHVPTRSQAEAIASAAVSRNLPGEPFAPPVVSLTPPALGEPFRATVRVEKTFASTIQRITFRISATAAAQLGQSPAGSTAAGGSTATGGAAGGGGPAAAGGAAGPQSRPYVPGCFAARVSTTSAGSGSTVGSPTVVDLSVGGQARSTVYVRPGATILWYVPVTTPVYAPRQVSSGVTLLRPRQQGPRAGGGSGPNAPIEADATTSELTGAFTVPAGPTAGDWSATHVTKTVSGVTVQVQGSAAFGDFPQCPR